MCECVYETQSTGYTVFFLPYFAIVFCLAHWFSSELVFECPSPYLCVCVCVNVCMYLGVLCHYVITSACVKMRVYLFMCFSLEKVCERWFLLLLLVPFGRFPGQATLLVLSYSRMDRTHYPIVCAISNRPLIRIHANMNVAEAHGKTSTSLTHMCLCGCRNYSVGGLCAYACASKNGPGDIFFLAIFRTSNQCCWMRPTNGRKEKQTMNGNWWCAAVCVWYMLLLAFKQGLRVRAKRVCVCAVYEHFASWMAKFSRMTWKPLAKVYPVSLLDDDCRVRSLDRYFWIAS